MADAPSSYSQKFGTISTKRGQLEHLKLFSWDAIPYCPNQYASRPCPALKYCEFKKSTGDEEVRCGVQNQYLRSTAEMIFRNFGAVLAEEEFYQIGIHVIPLYRMLIRLKLYELGVENPINTTERGTISANPIYREIRETIRAITAQWVHLGLSGPGADKKSANPIAAPSVGAGDVELTPVKPARVQDFSKPGTYYESMANGTFQTKSQMKDQIRKGANGGQDGMSNGVEDQTDMGDGVEETDTSRSNEEKVGLKLRS